MRARDVMRRCTEIRLDDPATELLRAFADPDLRGAAVIAPDGTLVGMVGDEDVLNCLLPTYLVVDPALSRVLDDTIGERLRVQLEGKRVRDVVHAARPLMPPVDPDSTLIDIAVAMVRASEAAVLVAEDGHVVGIVTVDALLPALLGQIE